MHKRLSTLLIAVLALAAFGGLSAAANAKQGADDPAVQVRQSQGADDPAGDVRQSQGADDSKVRATRRAHRRARHGRGAHDRARPAHHTHGADDGPSHV